MKVAYESKVSATHEPAPPMNVWVADLLDDIDEVIDRADHLDIQALIQQPAELFHVWFKDTYQEKYLDGVDRALAIRRIHTKVSNAVGFHPVWEKRGAPCPDCNEFSLGGWSGGDLIECVTEDCPIRLTLDDYQQYCIERVKNENEK